MKRQKSRAIAKKSSDINTLIIKVIEKLKVIVIILVNTERLHITSVN